MEKKAKIIATLGPSIYSEKKLKQLVDNGVDAFRINFGRRRAWSDESDAARPVTSGLTEW